MFSEIRMLIYKYVNEFILFYLKTNKSSVEIEEGG